MEKILSIVVAAYQAADFLTKGIPTFMDERVMSDIEVMIVDDGSTDDWVDTEGLVELVNQLKTMNSDLVLTRAQLRHDDGELVETWTVAEFPVGREVPVDNHIAKLRKIEMHNCCMRTEMLREHEVRCHEHHFYTDLEWVMYSLMYVKTVTSLDILFYQYLVGRDGQSVSITGRQKHKQDYLDIGRWLSEFYEENRSKMSEAMKTHYERRIAEFLTGVYSLQMSYRSSQNRRELKEYDKELKKQFPAVYRANENLCVNLLRWSGFSIYSVAAMIYCKVNRI